MKSFYKIIHITWHTGWGTLEKRIFNESVWMDKNGQKIIIAAPKGTPLFVKAKEYGFKVYGIESGKFSLIKDYRFLKNIIHNEKPDICNHHGEKGVGAALLAAKKNLIPLRILSWYSNSSIKNSWYHRKVYKKLCHYIFTSDEKIRKELHTVFKLRGLQIFCIPDGMTESGSPPEKQLSGNFDPDLEKEHHSMDTLGKGILRIYNLHQVKLDNYMKPNEDGRQQRR